MVTPPVALPGASLAWRGRARLELDERLAFGDLRCCHRRAGEVLLDPLSGPPGRLPGACLAVADGDGGYRVAVARGVVGDEAGDTADEVGDLLLSLRHRVG